MLIATALIAIKKKTTSKKQQVYFKHQGVLAVTKLKPQGDTGNKFYGVLENNILPQKRHIDNHSF